MRGHGLGVLERATSLEVGGDPRSAEGMTANLGFEARASAARRRICAISLRMSLPRVQPIIPISRKEPFDDPEWLFEFKYDGFRALCYIEQGSRCRFISRRGNTFDRFGAFCEQVAAELGIEEAILDGELIAADESGRPQFYDLLRRARSPSYVVFDLLWLNDADLRSLPPIERRRCLQGILPKGSLVITEALSVEASRGGDGISSNSCERTISRASSQSASAIRTSRALSGSRSKTRTTRRKKGEVNCSIDHDGQAENYRLVERRRAFKRPQISIPQRAQPTSTAR